MKKNTKKLDIITVIVLVLIVAAVCISIFKPSDNAVKSAFEGEYENNIEDTPLSSLADKHIGVMTGSLYENFAKERYPDAPLSFFNNQPDMAAALTAGKIDCFCLPELTAQAFIEADPTLTYLNEPFVYLDYAFAFPKNQSSVELCNEINSFLADIRKSGLYDELVEIWLGKDESKKVIDMSGLKPERGTLKFATTGTFEPFSYVKDGNTVGLEIDFVVRFCKEYGYGIEISLMDFGAIIPGLTSNKYDLAACNITITEERAQSIRFSDSDYTAKAVAMVKKPGTTMENGESEGFFDSLILSFEKNFIRESRWQMIGMGILRTMLITVLAMIFGTILAFLLCMYTRSGSKLAEKVYMVYSKVLAGTPMVVLLMILYYVVFGSTGTSPITVAIIGFSLTFSVTVAEMLQTGIASVDQGQNEAALALGFTEKQSFFRIILPQAVMRVIPVYKGAVVAMLKNTSIVGYISVEDLTKVNDIIRSRTYEAFFPLIATAILYFLLAWLLTFILGRAELTIKPKRSSKNNKNKDTNK